MKSGEYELFGAELCYPTLDTMKLCRRRGTQIWGELRRCDEVRKSIEEKS